MFFFHTIAIANNYLLLMPNTDTDMKITHLSAKFAILKPNRKSSDR